MGLKLETENYFNIKEFNNERLIPVNISYMENMIFNMIKILANDKPKATLN